MGFGKKSSKARMIYHHLFEDKKRYIQEAVASDIRNQQKAINRQPNDIEKFKFGEAWFNDGLSLEDAPEDLRNNINFINGFNRSKRIRDIEDSLYELGKSYFHDCISFELIPENYRNNSTVLRGYQDAMKNSKSR